MMQKILWTVLLCGALITIWFGYQWWNGTTAVLHIDTNTNPPVDIQIDNLNHGEYMADLLIPAIEKKYKIYWGTDDQSLKQGVGMYDSQWTQTPDNEKHTVLSGHRDTVFTEMGDLEIGDALEVSYNGQSYIYQIDDIWITDANDRTVIVKKEKPTLTLTTCYPFDYIGSAPDRYIIQASLVPVET